MAIAIALGWVGPQEPGSAAPVPRVQVVAGTGAIDAESVDRVRAEVEAELPGLLAVFANKPKHTFFVHVHADRESMPAALLAHVHEDAPAFAMLGQHQIHLIRREIERTGADLKAVVRHELVHELLDQYVAPNGREIPRWFHEGLAQCLAGSTYLQASENDLVWRITARRLQPFYELTNSFPREQPALRVAYAQSYSYVSYLIKQAGLANLLAVARATDDFTSFDRALVGRLKRSTLALEDGWRHHVLHGSGAPWRVLLDQCFSLSLIALLPFLVIAVIRRLRRDQAVAGQLAASEAMAAMRAAEAQAQAQAEAQAAAAADAAWLSAAESPSFAADETDIEKEPEPPPSPDVHNPDAR